MLPTFRRRLVGLGSAVVAFGFLVGFVVWPLAALALRSFDADLSDGFSAAVSAVTSRASTRSTLAFTVGQALASTALTVVAGLPVAFVIARTVFWGRAALRALVLVPFVLPTMVVAAAFDAALGSVAPPLVAVLAAHVFFNLAVVVRVVGGFWSRLDHAAVQAAQVLGATPLTAWRTVTLPQLWPALGASSLLVFLFSFTSFGIIRALGGLRMATIETEIHRYVIARQEFDVAAVLAMIQVFVVVAVVLGHARLQRVGLRRAVGGDEASARRSAVRPSGPGQLAMVGLAVGVVVTLQGFPIALLIQRSLRVGSTYGLANYRALATRPDVLPVSGLGTLVNTARFAAVAVVAAVIVAAAAMVLIRRGGRLGRTLETLSLIPLGVSAVTLGFGYLVAFSRFDLRRNWWLVPLAHAVIGLPFVLASIGPALRLVDDRLRQAAATLGASPGAVARTVDWPLVRGSLLSGAGLAAAVSVGEFGATSFLARGDETLTAPLAIFRLLGTPGEALRGQAMALSVAVGALVALVAAVAEYRRVDGGSI